MRRKFLLFFFALTCYACQPNTSTEEQASQNTNANQGLPKSQFQNLVENCDFIDYILYNYNFSLSQNEKSQILSTLQQIGQPYTGSIESCSSPIGRIFFQSKGENILEADIYFSEGCTFYYFLENKNLKYANTMTNSGIAFYNQIFSQFQEHKKNN